MAAPVVNPGGVRQLPQAQRPFTTISRARPQNPATGGHYVPVGTHPNGTIWRLIHAIGPGQWAPGPPTQKAATTPATQKTATTTSGTTGGGGGGGGTSLPRFGTNAYFNQPLFQPGSQNPLAGRALYRAAKQLTNLTYDPLISQYQADIDRTTRQGAAAQQATAGYFNQLGQYAQSSAQDVQNAAGALNTTLQNIGTGTQTALDQFGKQAVSPALQSLSAMGLGGGATDALAQQIAGLKATAATQAASNQAYGAKVGENAATYAGTLPGTYALRGQERLGEMGQATQLAKEPILTKLASTRGEKAAAFGTNLGKLRQQEIDNLVTMSGLDIKRTAAASTAANAAATRTQAAANAAEHKRESDRTYNLAVQKFGQQTANDIYDRTHHLGRYKTTGAGAGGAGGGMKPLTTASQNTLRNSIFATQALLRHTINQYHHGVVNATTLGYAWHDLNSGRIKYLAGPQILNAAYNSLLKGLTPGDVAALHNMGLTNLSGFPISGGSSLSRFENAASQNLGF
jgi:hypothetical protein